MQVRFAEKLRSRKAVVWFLERLQKTTRLSTTSFSKKRFIQHWNDFVSFLYGGYSKINKEQKMKKHIFYSDNAHLLARIFFQRGCEQYTWVPETARNFLKL